MDPEPYFTRSVRRIQCHKLFYNPRYRIKDAFASIHYRWLLWVLLTLEARSRHLLQGADSTLHSATWNEGSLHKIITKWHHTIQNDTNTYPSLDISYTIVISQTNLWTIPKHRTRSLRTIKTTTISFNTIVPSDFLATPILITSVHFPTSITLLIYTRL